MLRLGSYVKHTLQAGKASGSGSDLICAIEHPIKHTRSAVLLCYEYISENSSSTSIILSQFDSTYTSTLVLYRPLY